MDEARWERSGIRVGDRLIDGASVRQLCDLARAGVTLSEQSKRNGLKRREIRAVLELVDRDRRRDAVADQRANLALRSPSFDRGSGSRQRDDVGPDNSALGSFLGAIFNQGGRTCKT